MDVTAELTRLSGLQQLQAIFAGKTGYAGIVKTLDLHPVSAEEGFVVFEGSPTQAVYNPLGSVHGGYAASLLDTVMGCAVHSRLQAGQGYTTLELKIAYHRALTDLSGPVRAEGRVISFGRRAAFGGHAERQGWQSVRHRDDDVLGVWSVTGGGTRPFESKRTRRRTDQLIVHHSKIGWSMSAMGSKAPGSSQQQVWPMSATPRKRRRPFSGLRVAKGQQWKSS